MNSRLPLTVLVALLLFNSACSTATPLIEKTSEVAPYTAFPSYKEYPFDSGDDVDMGFTGRELTRLATEQNLLSEGSAVIPEQMMTHQQLSETDMGKGIMERYTWDEDTYELVGAAANKIEDTYKMMKNGELFFEESMGFGASGPIHEWRLVNDKPAFTFSACNTIDSSVICNNDIWYDGSLISKEFGVEDPRYLFAYDGKLGFVASNGGSDSVWFNGAFITPSFDTIWTQNCCSFTEILPTVYENGTLLFYAKRGEANSLVEIDLITKDMVSTWSVEPVKNLQCVLKNIANRSQPV